MAEDILSNANFTFKIKLTQDNVREILSAANLFQLNRLKDYCCYFLEDNFHASNVLGIHAFLSLHGDPNVTSRCNNYINNWGSV